MDIKATVNYHVNSTYRQAFHFDVDGVIGNLVSPKLENREVVVKDLRQSLSTTFDEDGILFEESTSSIDDFSGNAWQQVYEQEISAFLKGKINAQEVLVFDHTVRIDDEIAIRKPARNVHNDYTRDSANQRLVDLIGADKAATYQEGNFAFVNLWRPIETIKTSPLGFIRPRSMNAKDWIDIELIYPDRKGQILGVIENVNHEWFYFSNMTPQEAIIFNIYDNNGRPHLAHSALDILGEKDAGVTRKSIETRTLVRY